MTKTFYLPLFLSICFTLTLSAGTIMTVRGPIDSEELGKTLEHEHILVDFIGAEETGYHRWDRDEVVKQVLPHLKEAKALGYQSLVECTPAFLGRDPQLLKSLSEETNLHIVTNTGYYGARQNKYIPKEVQNLSVNELAARWIREFNEGIEDTRVKPGFIKISVDRDPKLSPMHENLLRAACRTHLETGLTIACHTGPSQVIFQMAEILHEEGVAPGALIWVHATTDTPENQIKAAQLGLWISIDNVTDKPERIDFVVTGLKALKKANLLEHVLISHDAGWYRPGEPQGGNFRPYTAISKSLVPKLLATGFTQSDIDQLLVQNPQSAFELGVKKADVHLGMGLRVGEVTQHSAIIWTRVTKNTERNLNGYRDLTKREPRVDEYSPLTIKIKDREGSMPGASGQVRLRYQSNGHSGLTDWINTKAENDYVHQFQLNGLKPRSEYSVTVETRPDKYSNVTDTVSGSFATPAYKSEWQDVTFSVITCQSYWDLDNQAGFYIYPSMEKMNLDFMVAAGDMVYLDSESPRARTIDLARYHWHRMYSLSRHVDLHKNLPTYWEVDDHDSWANDGWPTMEAKWMNPLTFEEGFDVYREQVPIGDQLYRTIRWGKGLQIWLVEGRMYRSPNTMPDGPEKLIWGHEQREWLMRTILESDAEFKVLISPTPIVGPDRSQGKNDNHSNEVFAHAGNYFRNWTKEQNLKNFYVCNGDRHWQYMSVDPATGLREFSVGPPSDIHAGGNPPQDHRIQPFMRVGGGFLTVSVTRESGAPTIAFRHHDVDGKVVHEYKAVAP
ncbi:MAG: alkaline phosphatase D family protein [Verrucomicrobia bacterium]|nr:alkaline phosphatase D family protein [Verrucomicrobiota bacterium]